VAESGKWICDKCRSEILRLLDGKLQNALLQIDDLTRKNKELEEELRLATTGREVGSFPGIRKDQLHRFIENRDLGIPDTVVIHVGTNELRRTGNLDYVMGDVYDLVNTEIGRASCRERVSVRV
jgi:hypothetical protein